MYKKFSLSLKDIHVILNWKGVKNYGRNLSVVDGKNHCIDRKKR